MKVVLPEEMSCAGWFLVLGAAWALGGSWGQGEGRAAAANPRDAAAIQPRMQGAASRAGRMPDVCGWVDFGVQSFFFTCFFTCSTPGNRSTV